LAQAQTSEIQNKVREALAQEKEKASQALKAAQEELGKEKPKEKLASLEVLLAQALKDNPDIRVAESKLSEAEAELNRVRLLVTQKVVAQQRAITDQRAALSAAEDQLGRMRQLQGSGAVTAKALESVEVN